jgi:hypothetical protein
VLAEHLGPGVRLDLRVRRKTGLEKVDVRKGEEHVGRSIRFKFEEGGR